MTSLNEMMTSSDEMTTAVSWNGGLTTVWVMDHNTGNQAVGHAKHDPEDSYSPEIGHRLALARALTRLYRKNEKTYVRLTK
jgi:hypothetical protein